MKRLLLVAATQQEIQPAIAFLQKRDPAEGTFRYGQLEVEICITGAGMVPTAFELGKRTKGPYDFAVNAGLAGSFGKFRIGDVVNVNTDQFSELGAEDGESFLPIESLGLGTQSVTVHNSLQSEITSVIPLAKGITVNTVHGNEKSIGQVHARTRAEIESMEGAAFIYAANASGWKCIQLRAISNLVERRNKESWNLGLAITNLNEVVIRLIEELSVP